MGLALLLDKQEFWHKMTGLNQVTQVAFGRPEPPVSTRSTYGKTTGEPPSWVSMLQPCPFGRLRVFQDKSIIKWQPMSKSKLINTTIPWSSRKKYVYSHLHIMVSNSQRLIHQLLSIGIALLLCQIGQATGHSYFIDH